MAVTFLGTGGFLIEARGQVLLTGPLLSNPNVAFPRPDAALIHARLPDAARRATMIVVGHGHYDHLVEVPFIAREADSAVRIYGSPSVYNTLQGDASIAKRVVAISGKSVGDSGHSGVWIPEKHKVFRIMAFEGRHSPVTRIFGKDVFFAKDTEHTELTRLPLTGPGWKVGEVYAYLIDILAPNDTTPIFTIYYQDTAHPAPSGFPTHTLVNRGVDLAILTVANAHLVGSPGPILKFLQPRFAIASHWEDFFRAASDSPRVSPKSKIPAFEAALMTIPGANNWSRPMPMSTFLFATNQQRDSAQAPQRARFH